MTLNEKIKTIAKAINEDRTVCFGGTAYTVSGYGVTKEDGTLSLSVRLKDQNARSSWLWIDERKYFEKVEKKK